MFEERFITEEKYYIAVGTYCKMSIDNGTEWKEVRLRNDKEFSSKDSVISPVGYARFERDGIIFEIESTKVIPEKIWKEL